MKTKKKKRRLIAYPCRVAAILLSAAALMMIARFPERAVSAERQQSQLTAAAAEYYDAQAKYNRLNAELSQIHTDDFIERTARREYGYCWYGETIYEVANLDEIREKVEFEVYGEDE